MSPKIRQDLVVPYHHVPAKPRQEVSGTITQTLPMAAMFMRNKLLSWTSMFLAVQAYLNEPTNKPKADEGSQPPLLKIVFALIALLMCYVELLFPQMGPAGQRAKIASTASSTIASTATATATAAASAGK